MNQRCFLLGIVAFSIGCVLLFSGQQRQNRSGSSSRQSVSEPRRRTDTPAGNRNVPPRRLPAGKESLPPPPENSEHEKEPELEIPLLAITPDKVPWPPARDGAQGTAPRNVTLLGDPRLPELYVTRTLIPRGKKILPHIHSDSRTVVVLSGTYYYGIGETFDGARMIAFPPGSFLTEPAGVPHFTWARDGEVIVQTTAIGPSGTRLLPDKKEPSHGR